MDAPLPLTPRLRPYTCYELVGVAIESLPAQAARAIAVRLRVEGSGLESRVEVLDGVEEQLAPEVEELLTDAVAGKLSQSAACNLRGLLTARAIALVQEMLTAGGEEPLAIGVLDPGCWRSVEHDSQNYTALCEAAVLAEATGLSVIDAFPARDLACGGRGEPLDSLPLWMLLHDARRARLVVQRQANWRLTYLPASCEASGAARVMTFCAELNAEQAADPLPAAEWILATVASRVPRHPPLGQIVFASPTAGPQQLRERLADQLSDVSQADLVDLELQPEWLTATCAGLLAFLHVEQIPAGGTLLTGASAARVLGQLTPGNPLHWRRLLRLLAEHQPATMSLRSAI